VQRVASSHSFGTPDLKDLAGYFLHISHDHSLQILTYCTRSTLHNFCICKGGHNKRVGKLLNLYSSPDIIRVR